MAVFAAFTPSINFQCPICLQDPNEDSEVVAHEGLGQLHPMHKKCLALWEQNHAGCPACQVVVERSSLIPYQERATSELRDIARDGVRGSLSAMVGGAVGLSLGSLLDWATRNVNTFAYPMIGSCVGGALAISQLILWPWGIGVYILSICLIYEELRHSYRKSLSFICLED